MNKQYQHIIQHCNESKIILATAESCTGGWIAKCITDVPGSSAVFLGGVVTYSNELKQSLLNVTGETLETYGAVSEQTVTEMVVGICQKTGADVGIAVSGVAGPSGGSDEKPVGTVVIGVGNVSQKTVHRYQFDGDRESIRKQAVDKAAEMILKFISVKQ